MDFYVEDKVLDIGVKIIFAIVREIDNHNISEEWRVYRERRLQELLEEYRGIDVHADPVLEGFNILHDKSGVKRRKNIPASENLIKLLVSMRVCFLSIRWSIFTTLFPWKASWPWERIILTRWKEM